MPRVLDLHQGCARRLRICFENIGILCLEHCDDGHHHAGDRTCQLRSVDRLRLRLRSALGRPTMIFDYSLAGLVTAGLMVYLIYALLKPELF